LGSFVVLLPESGGLLKKKRRLMRAQIGDSEGKDEGWLMSRIQLVIQKVYKRSPATYVKRSNIPSQESSFAFVEWMTLIRF